MKKWMAGDRFTKDGKSGEVLESYDSGYCVVLWDHMVGLYTIPEKTLQTFSKEEDLMEAFFEGQED